MTLKNSDSFKKLYSETTAFVQSTSLKDGEREAFFLPNQLWSWVQMVSVLFTQGNPREDSFASFLQITLSQKLSESILFKNLESKNSGNKNLGRQGQFIDCLAHIYLLYLL